ncbi:MAG TPA: PepSY-associated TM helix domain-containing protein, partial [Pirellulales bacterium]
MPLILLGLTGAVLSVESELDRWLNPSLWQVVPSGRKLDYQAVLEQVRAQHPQVMAMRLPAHDDVAIEFSLPAGRLVYFDPYASRILGERRREQILLVRIHQFHTRLLAGAGGSYVMGTASLVLVLVSLTGLVLWWRARIFTLSGLRSARRFNFEAHHALGLYGAIFWLAIGTTGAMMTFEDVVDPAVHWLTHSAESRPPKLHSTTAAGRQPISIDEALRIARQALPEAKATLAAIAARPTDVLAVYMKHPEDRTPAGRSRVYLDQYSGRVLHVTDTRQVPLG